MTVFRHILEDAVADVPGARGAVFADWEGEAVDEFSNVGSTNIRIVAAHWGIVLFQAARRFSDANLGEVDQLVMCFSKHWVLLRRIASEYFVVITVKADEGNLGKAIASMDRAEQRLLREM